MRAAIEAVTVCVGYDDFLAESIDANRAHFARWVVVTTREDEGTRRLCHSRGIECLVTQDFFRDDAKFDKARGIDRAIQGLSLRDWVLHLDADIVLPGTFGDSLEDAHLDERVLYGCDRFMVRGWGRWQRLRQSGFLDKFARSAHHNVSFPEGYPVGSRWADVHQGYVPIGFFQLFHGGSVLHRGIRHRRYSPYGHNDAARTDVQFGLLWDRRDRELLPELIVAHLESEAQGAPVGANWSGRTTPRFGPPPGGGHSGPIS